MGIQLTAANSEFALAAAPAVTAPPFSVSMWLFSDANPTDNDFCAMQIQDDGVSDELFRMGLNAGGGALRAVATENAGSGQAETSTTMSQNTWHHGLFVYGATNSRAVYLDGAGKGTNTTEVTPANIDSIDLGREGDSTAGDHWDGRIAEVGIWNVELTDAEALILAAGYTPRFVRPGSLVHYWQCLQETATIRDLIGTLNLTGQNTPTVGDHPPVIFPVSGLIIPTVVAAVGGGIVVLRRRIEGC